MWRLALLPCLAAFHLTAQAACQTGLAERLHAKLHPKRALMHELAVCEAWRGHLGRSIVVLPMAGDTAGIELQVLVVQQPDNGNSERATVLASLSQAIPPGADALQLSDIELDSTRYRLAPELRSFGLRIARRSITLHKPASSETLWLYGLQGNKLQLLLDGLQTKLERGQWDMSCSGQFEKQQSQLSVSRSAASKGLADLIVRRSDWRASNEMQGDECVELSEPARYREFVLRYDGSRYAPPRD
ncbi:MAG TPA: hypothetical protein VLJ19_18460 [Variovorax sp.]|nr:hypothetical protein [Variovorax sp.]